VGPFTGMTGPKKLRLLPLAASIFFMVSGGAYGLEELVACGYPAAFAALLVTPLLWSLPTALLVGELASALPKAGGYYAWVRRAMGPFWGFQEAWLSLVASVFEMAIYPTLFTLYLGYFFPSVSAGAGAVAVGAALIAACAAWNLLGAAPVGGGAIGLGVAVQLPFLALALFAFGHAAAGGHLPAPGAPPQAGVLTGLLVAMWNYMGWDNASTIAEEVERPGHTYPRALLLALGLIVGTYLLPVAAAALAGLRPDGWTTGAWVTAAREVGGGALALTVALGGMVCGLGMYNALLLSYSRLPVALADHGFLPAWLARRAPKTGAPAASILVCSTLYAACLGLGFIRLVELDVLLYGASLLLEFVALVVLRVREPRLARPFKVGGGTAVAALLGVGPMVLLGLALWDSKDERVGPLPSLVLGALLVGLGPLVYLLRRHRATDLAADAN
jgi:amino acid transporter